MRVLLTFEYTYYKPSQPESQEGVDGFETGLCC